MKRIFFITALITLTLNLEAQTYITLGDTSSIYKEVDVNPQFPGGLKMFDKYIDDNSVKVLMLNHALGVIALPYTEEKTRTITKPGIILIGFFIEKTGKITMPRIIKGLTPQTDSAALHLMRINPLWKPGFKNEFPVRTFAKIGVKFYYAGDTYPAHASDVAPSKGQSLDIKIDEPMPENSIDPKKIYNTVEKLPEFPGGRENFKLYVKQNFILPQNFNNIIGTVILSFVVERDGSLTAIKVIKGLSPDIDKEAIRVVSKGPKWNPGIWNSKPVRVAHSAQIDVPVNP